MININKKGDFFLRVTVKAVKIIAKKNKSFHGKFSKGQIGIHQLYSPQSTLR